MPLFAPFFCALSSRIHGLLGIICIMVLFFFKLCMYPTIFISTLQDFGGNTKRGGAFVMEGVSGGAIFPPIERAIVDKANTRIGQIVPISGYAYLTIYAFFLQKHQPHQPMILNLID
jgi:FHS family L-fucose permease-like MFS transporter